MDITLGQCAEQIWNFAMEQEISLEVSEPMTTLERERMVELTVKLGADPEWALACQSSYCMGDKAVIKAQTLPRQEGWQERHYAVALHELGHHFTGMDEVRAWEWAMENALMWTREMAKFMELGLMSYFLCHNVDQSFAADLLDMSTAMVGFHLKSGE